MANNQYASAPAISAFAKKDESVLPSWMKAKIAPSKRGGNVIADGSIMNDLFGIRGSYETMSPNGNKALDSDYNARMWGVDVPIGDQLSVFADRRLTEDPYGIRREEPRYGAKFKGDGYDIDFSGQKVPLDRNVYGSAAPRNENQYKFNLKIPIGG